MEELIGKPREMNPQTQNILTALINNKAEEFKMYKINPTEEEEKRR